MANTDTADEEAKNEELEEMQSIIYQYIQYQNVIRLDRTIHSLIHTAKSHSTIGVSSSSGRSYSSGGGFGGGSSSSGSGGGGGG